MVLTCLFTILEQTTSKKVSYTEEEVSVLRMLYGRGLRSKIKHKDLLKEGMQKTGLPSERIMV